MWEDVKMRSKDFQGHLKLLGEMLDDPDYSYAWNTLESMESWIKKNESITDKMVKAIENIRAKPSGQNMRDEYDNDGWQ